MRGSRCARCVVAAAASWVLIAIGLVAPRVAVAAPVQFAVDAGVVYAESKVHLERFGTAVALSGDTMVVGVPDHDTPAGLLNAGMVQVFVRSGGAWILQASLSQPTAAAEDRFGASVAISGDRVVVGAPGYNGAVADSGAAFVFTRTGTAWSSAVPLPLADAIGGDRTGQSVDIDGGTIVVGCPGADTGRGKIRPYTWSGSAWVAGTGLADPLGEAGDDLGGCVSVSGGIVAASATGDDSPGAADAGAVLVFPLGTATPQAEAKIFATSPVAGERFGTSIDLGASGAVLVTGSQSFDAGAAVDSGRAYVHVRGATGWQSVAALENPTASGVPENDLFGSAVAFDGGDLILVGAMGADGVDGNDGAAYYFQLRNGVWGFAWALAPGASPCCEQFGASVALSAGAAVIGAPLASANT